MLPSLHLELLANHRPPWLPGFRSSSPPATRRRDAEPKPREQTNPREQARQRATSRLTSDNWRYRHEGLMLVACPCLDLTLLGKDAGGPASESRSAWAARERGRSCSTQPQVLRDRTQAVAVCRDALGTCLGGQPIYASATSPSSGGRIARQRLSKPRRSCEGPRCPAAQRGLGRLLNYAFPRFRGNRVIQRHPSKLRAAKSATIRSRISASGFDWTPSLTSTSCHIAPNACFRIRRRRRPPRQSECFASLSRASFREAAPLPGGVWS